MKQILYCLLCMLLVYRLPVKAQDVNSWPNRLIRTPDKLFHGLNKRVDQAQQQLSKQTIVYLNRLMRQEQKLKKKLTGRHPAKADSIFSGSQAFYTSLQQQLQQPVTGNQLFTKTYSPRLDSMTTALHFMDRAGLLPNHVTGHPEIQTLLAKYNDLQGSLNQTEKIKKLLAERQQQLQQQLQLHQLPGFNKWQQEFYYYHEQVKTIKQLWEDPSALERRLTGYLCRLPPFRQFFDQHSQLAQVFQLPGNATSLPVNTTLQTRDALNEAIQSNGVINANMQGQLQNNLPTSSGAFPAFSTGNLPVTAGNAGSANMRDFTPNHQRTRSFLKRLELGTTMQTSKAGHFFPATTDLGISLGYRLNDKSTIGIGSSGKIGWGKGWQAIRLTGEGISLRSFTDVKLKGSIWITGGWEYHYQQAFSEVRALHNVPNWKQEALLGISKIISLKSNAFKKYRIQLLYDFLHNQQLPVTEPVKFRMGYTL